MFELGIDKRRGSVSWKWLCLVEQQAGALTFTRTKLLMASLYIFILLSSGRDGTGGVCANVLSIIWRPRDVNFFSLFSFIFYLFIYLFISSVPSCFVSQRGRWFYRERVGVDCREITSRSINAYNIKGGRFEIPVSRGIDSSSTSRA